MGVPCLLSLRFPLQAPWLSGRAQAHAVGTRAPSAPCQRSCPAARQGPPILPSCPSQVFLPELRRHKRGFMRLATAQAFSRLQDAAAAQRLFISYLRDQLAQR